MTLDGVYQSVVRKRQGRIGLQIYPATITVKRNIAATIIAATTFPTTFDALFDGEPELITVDLWVKISLVCCPVVDNGEKSVLPRVVGPVLIYLVGI